MKTEELGSHVVVITLTPIPVTVVNTRSKLRFATCPAYQHTTFPHISNLALSYRFPTCTKSKVNLLIIMCLDYVKLCGQFLFSHVYYCTNIVYFDERNLTAVVLIQTLYIVHNIKFVTVLVISQHKFSNKHP